MWFDGEDFVLVTGETDYYVSRSGRVLSTKRGKPRILSPGNDGRQGYLFVHFSHGAKEQRHKKVHRLVAEAFMPNPLNKREVNHIDANKQNNHMENLEWVTPKENTAHAQDAGLRPSFEGDKHWHAQLTEGDVRRIRDIHIPSGLSNTEIAQAYGVSRKTVCKIRRRETWRHIP